MEPWMITVGLFFISNLLGAAVVWGGMRQKLTSMKEQRLDDKDAARTQRTNDQAVRAEERLADSARWATQRTLDDKQEISLDALEKRGLKIMFRDQCGDLRTQCRGEWKEDFAELKRDMKGEFRALRDQVRGYMESKVKGGEGQ